ncbi:t-SNARE complex subunit (syntaxin) [Lysinibacillus sp. TE18511]
MKQGQIKVTKENLLQWIENYRWMMVKYRKNEWRIMLWKN